ncbi:MAG: hypothetical protein KJO02_05780 [Erythrobacter sp.]|nr:hypothetical protein [Erythrobacter sp.]
MSLRTTFIGLGVIVGLCAAMLYGISSYFDREAGMRDAEMAFQDKHGTKTLAPSRQMQSGTGSSSKSTRPEVQPPAAEELDLDSWYAESGSEGAAPSLESWYASAGSNDGPADTTPTDNSYLINDTEPFSTTDPL